MEGCVWDWGASPRCEKTADALNTELGGSLARPIADYYHAGLSADRRAETQKACHYRTQPFSRTVWRLYGGAKGIAMWYHEGVEHGQHADHLRDDRLRHARGARPSTSRIVSREVGGGLFLCCVIYIQRGRD